MTITSRRHICLNFMEKSNDQNQSANKKARSTLNAVGLLAHAIAKSLDGGSKVQKAVFVDFSSAFNTIPRWPCLSNLPVLEEAVTRMMDEGHTVFLICLDSVSHKCLLAKMKSLGLGDVIVRLIETCI